MQSNVIFVTKMRPMNFFVYSNTVMLPWNYSDKLHKSVCQRSINCFLSFLSLFISLPSVEMCLQVHRIPPKAAFVFKFEKRRCCFLFSSESLLGFLRSCAYAPKSIQKMSMGKQKKPKVSGERKMQMECCALLTFVCCSWDLLKFSKYW